MWRYGDSKSSEIGRTARIRIGALHLRKGPYKITVIKKRRISCQRASSLFTRFLANPSGLPKGWKLKVQSATFLKKGKHFGFRVKQV